MIPRPDQALTALAGKVAGLAVDLTSNYAVANAAMTSMLLQILGGEAEHAIASRHQDAAELKILFASATHAPGGEERNHFAASIPANLQQSSVASWHAEGMRLLIQLHAWAEQHDAGLNERIWDFLRTHSERNKLLE